MLLHKIACKTIWSFFLLFFIHFTQTLIFANGSLWFPSLHAAIINEFPIPTVNSGPFGITTGPDGNLWFTESLGNKIGQITTAGIIIQEFPIPTANSGPSGITVGPDGNLWFAEQDGNNIGRITPTGVITEFPVPTVNSIPSGITAGPDGNLWFTEQVGNKIGRITPTGVITEFTIPTLNSGPNGITVGPDGNLWFTEQLANQIGRITTTGTFAEFPIPTANSNPQGITAGPDGALWFTEFGTNRIGRITTAGVVTNEFLIPTAGSGPFGITTGPDGNLWFTEQLGNKIGQMTTAGIFINEFLIPTANSQPAGITVGPDGNLWFTEFVGNKIGQLILPETSTILTTSPISSSTFGQPVTLTATVSPSLATGTVTFFDGVTPLGTISLVSGMASLTTSSLAVGMHSLTARYNGDANFDPSISPAVIFTVNKSPTTTALVTSPPGSSTFGQPVTLTATVSPSSATGTVTFFDGATNLGTVSLVGGSASLTTSTLAVGTHSLTAHYNGDANFDPSTSPAVVFTVNKITTTTTLVTSPPGSSTFGQPVTLTATVSPSSATGTVTFFDGSTPLGTVSLVNGSASLTTSSLAIGSHSLTAHYNGDANFNPSTSLAVIFTVNKITTTTTLVTSPPDSSIFGQPVTLTATVSPSSATGTVTFFDGATPLGTVSLVNGSASLTTSSLAIGSHSLTARYNGNANFNPSTSSAVIFTVNGNSTTTILVTSPPTSSTFGEPVTLTAMVSPPSATGTVTFFDGATPLRTVSLLGGSASFTTSSLAIGTHSLTAHYNGDANFDPSTSPVVIFTVNPAVFPPRHLKGIQKANEFATQTDLINILTWEAPKKGNVPIAYRIYRNKKLTELAAVISSHDKLEFKDHQRKKGKTYTYYIVSVDEFRNISEPAVVKVK